MASGVSTLIMLTGLRWLLAESGGGVMLVLELRAAEV